MGKSSGDNWRNRNKMIQRNISAREAYEFFDKSEVVQGVRVDRIGPLEFNQGVVLDCLTGMKNGDHVGIILRVASRDGEKIRLDSVVLYRSNGYIGIDSSFEVGREHSLYKSVDYALGMAA